MTAMKIKVTDAIVLGIEVMVLPPGLSDHVLFAVK